MRACLCFLMLCAVVSPVSVIAQGQFLDSNGVPIYYEVTGSGEPILLIHGNGADSRSWTNAGVVQSFSKEHRVVTLDCRGSGKSGKPHDPLQYGREMGLDVVRLLDHLGIRRAHIVGYSMGAEIAAVLLVTSPERFLTGTLAGYAGRFQWTSEEQKRTELEASEIERDGISRSMLRRLSPAERPPTEVEIAQRQKAALADPSFDQHAIAARMRSAKDRAITPAQVAAVKIPTLAIAGSADPNLAGIKELGKLRPDVKVTVIEGATHGGATGVILRPEFVTTIREFIAANHGK